MQETEGLDCSTGGTVEERLTPMEEREIFNFSAAPHRQPEDLYTVVQPTHFEI